MAMNETIDIISSDSETEVDVVGETNQSSTLRKLPSTLSGSGRNENFRGYAEPPQKIALYNHGKHALNGHSLSANGHAQGKGPNRYQYNDAVGPSNQNSSRAQKYRDGDGYKHQNVHTFQIGNGFEKISPHQAPTRTLPSSMYPSTSNNIPRPGTQSWDTHGIPHHQAGLSSGYNKSYARDFSGMSSGNDAFMYENRNSRVLPPSLMQARSATATMGGDSSFRSGTGEERAEESDERRIYQAALENLSGQRNEVDLPDGLLSVPLLRHQKVALAWMLQKESTSLHCWGGILADDQGLGKTISMISLIQMQRYIESKFKPKDPSNHKTVALDLDDDDDGDKVNVSLVNRKTETETIALDIDDDDEAKNGNDNQSNNAKAEESVDIKPNPEASTSSARVISKRRPDAGTLVVCPASVLRQWARELGEKVSPEARLSVLIYHGGSRTKDPVELATYDVVVTTYAIVTNEVPKQALVDDEDDERNGDRYGVSGEFSNKRKKKVSGVNKKGKKGVKGFGSSGADLGGPLARVKWNRVILDEAQTIKNHRTQVARACVGLKAKRRWCLSGTPIQNTIDDLYSYFRFLKYDPYAEYRSFCNTLKLPISRNAVQGYKKLQAVLRAIMLRRTKGSLIDGKPIIDLPPKTINMSRVDFAAEERGFYTRLESDSRTQFKAYAAAGTLNQNYANILLMLLRLRQACDHPCLVKQYETDNIGNESVEMAQSLPQEMLRNLLSLLEASQPICRKCEDPPEDPVVTMCGHVFCYECVAEYLTGDDNICPATGCKEQIGSDLTFSKTTLRRSISDDLDGTSNDFQFVDKSVVMQKNYSSSKIKALLKILKDNLKQDDQDSKSRGNGECNENSPLGKEVVDDSDSDYEMDVKVVKHTTRFSSSLVGPIKTIVFSQWTSMLDLVEAALRQAHINYRRLDGQMSLLARDKGVKDFNNSPEVTVMIMSLKAGNLGLNMVAACHVVLLDLWWNPTTEDQAVDRAHRIGQTRPVTVTRLTIKDTVEDRILALQEEKRNMVASAFGEDPSGGATARLTVDDLKYLFMV